MAVRTCKTVQRLREFRLKKELLKFVRVSNLHDKLINRTDLSTFKFSFVDVGIGSDE